MNLNDLKPGQSAEIIEINCLATFKKRLFDLGVNVGDKVLLIRKAPLNDPIIIKVKDFVVSLRVEQAKKIMVSI